jgi:prevent-host-death family protein
MEVGVRALRDGLSRHLDDVKEGHTITVTERGRAIARIVPVDGPTTLEQLIAEGRVTAPDRGRRKLGPPVKVAGTVSDLIADQRR